MPQNEINTEITVQNTAHHKAVVKARNEFYYMFKSRFNVSIALLMDKFDSDRHEEHRFNAYWQSNLKEITVKHI